MKPLFKERLKNQRLVGDRHSLGGFEGVVCKVDPYAKRVIIDKNREEGNTNYSFSMDQKRSYDAILFIEKEGWKVFIKTENGKLHRWCRVRRRLVQMHDYWVVTL